ncbi:MAG: acyl-CoA thioesterase [bacterium]|nr:acyl-CoA thioesterase [bacterium]MCP5066120.1 acyl-CoA thioesterase [bacterium]
MNETSPSSTATSTVLHRVPFYETDAMGVVHHSNYVRYLELARIRWMDEHHRPYREYIAEDRHFATTRVEVDYKRVTRFDEEISIRCWLEWVRGASLRLAYRLDTSEGMVAIAATEHALVDSNGRVRRIPAADREQLKSGVEKRGR